MDSRVSANIWLRAGGEPPEASRSDELAHVNLGRFVVITSDDPAPLRELAAAITEAAELLEQ